MRKLLLVMLVPLGCLLALSLAGIHSGCGLFDDATVTIDLPDQTFPFTLDASSVKGQLETELGQTLPDNNIPAGLITSTYSFPVDLPPQQVDLSTNQQLQQYENQLDKIKAVTVKYVKYTLTTNTLNFASPSADLYLDDLGTTAITASAQKVAVIPSIPAGSTAPGEVNFVTGGREILSSYVLLLKFALLGTATVLIDSNTRTVPSGVLSGTVTIGLQFKVDPL